MEREKVEVDAGRYALSNDYCDLTQVVAFVSLFVAFFPWNSSGSIALASFSTLPSSWYAHLCLLNWRMFSHCLVNHIVAVTECCKFHSECVWSFLLSGQFESVHYCWTTREANASSDVIRNLSVGLPEPLTAQILSFPEPDHCDAVDIYIYVSHCRVDFSLYAIDDRWFNCFGKPFQGLLQFWFLWLGSGVPTSATCLCQTLATCQHPVIIKP